MTLRDRLSPYPALLPYREFRLDAGQGHVIHVEECGNPQGQPAIVIHGGPGGGSNPTMRRYHDPQRYRIILFDQRGCGRSTPHASTENNTTQHLIADMELIRTTLAIERWQLFGGSWGSTLALAYAEAYPQHVASMILRGIFLLTKAELSWFYQEGCSFIYPEAFADFQKPVAPADRGDMIAAYQTLLKNQDAAVRLAAAKAWSVWEGRTLSLMPEAGRIERFAADSYALAFASIENHYFVNHGFFNEDGALLRNASRLCDIPGVIVHGRYDVVTPVRSAFLLHQAWPQSDLRIVADAGHAMTEPGITHELVKATRQYSDLA